MPDHIRSVAVFCGSRPGHDPVHAAAARALGRGLAEAGLTLVYGGGGTVEPGQTAYVEELLRDTGFALLACWLIVRPRTFASLDSRLVDSERT